MGVILSGNNDIGNFCEEISISIFFLENMFDVLKYFGILKGVLMEYPQ